MVEARHEHLVPSLELAGERAGEEEVQRGHALPERDLPRVAPEERARSLVRGVDQLVRVARRLIGSPDVRIVLAQVARNRVDDLVRALGLARPVEEGEPAVESPEASAGGRDVQESRAHATLHAYAGATVSDAPMKQARGFSSAKPGPARADPGRGDPTFGGADP